MAKQVSCGIIVTDGKRLLLGHATRSSRWDIPKGMAEPGELFAAAAVRELAEETSLAVVAAELRPLGVHTYLRDKDLALFVWMPPSLPLPEGLTCSSTFTLPDGTELPEFDRFGLFDWDVALGKVGKNLARVLRGEGPICFEDFAMLFGALQRSAEAARSAFHAFVIVSAAMLFAPTTIHVVAGMTTTGYETSPATEALVLPRSL